MKLNDAAIRRAKTSDEKPDKPKKFPDGDGLYLLVYPNTRKVWRLDYRLGKIRKTVSFGRYPEVTLSEARGLRLEARRQIAAGKDPSVQRRAAKAPTETFEALGREWLEKQAPNLEPTTVKKLTWMLEHLLFPDLGPRPVSALEPADLLVPLKRIEARGRRDTAHRAKQLCGQVLRYAVAHGRAARDASQDLKGALAPVVTTSRAAVTNPGEIGQLLRAIDGYEGSYVVGVALQLAALVFVRPGELRKAEWKEFDLTTRLWRIPAARMKVQTDAHLVPLAKQSIVLLKKLAKVTGDGDLLFPSIRAKGRAISDNTLNAALRRLGYDKTQATAHGFRAMASTRLNEMGWAPDLIERQLAHLERNKVRAAYNRAQHLPERTKMMQAWADHLDHLRGV